MHDPQTVAHELYLGKKKKKNGHYRTPFLTIWHVDPEKDGTDDSCGWFIRDRHLPKDLVEIIKKEFEFNFKHNYWFNEAGYPKFSTMGVGLCMYSNAAWRYFMWKHGNNPTDKARRQYKSFMRKYLFEILHFSENPTDSLYDSINMKYGVESKDYRCSHFATIVLADIMRKLRPWYKHPRWHIHHWRLQFPLWRRFYRRYFERCDICKKRLKGQATYADWNGTKKWCETCNKETVKVPVPPPPKE